MPLAPSLSPRLLFFLPVPILPGQAQMPPAFQFKRKGAVSCDTQQSRYRKTGDKNDWEYSMLHFDLSFIGVRRIKRQIR